MGRAPTLAILPWMWIAAACIGDAAAAQVQVVVPPVATATDGNRFMNSHFRSNSTRRIQVLVDESLLRGLAGKQLRQLAFRKDVRFLNEYGKLSGSETASMRIYASWSTAPVEEPSIDFAQNRGTSRQLVFDGAVTLPKVADSESRSVTTFAPSEAPTIPLLPGFWHQPNRTLVLEFETRSNNATYRWSWPVDAATQFEPGTTTPIGKPCWDAPTKPDAMRIVKGSLRPGMHIRITSDAPPNPSAAFLMIGLSDKTAFGVVPLPLRIAEPQCDVVVSPDILMPSTFFAGAGTSDSGWTASVFATPAVSHLFGATIYMQYLFLHIDGNKPAIKTGNGVAATFTKNKPSLGVSMVVSMDPSAATGRVFLDFSPVMQLTGK